MYDFQDLCVRILGALISVLNFAQTSCARILAQIVLLVILLGAQISRRVPATFHLMSLRLQIMCSRLTQIFFTKSADTSAASQWPFPVTTIRHPVPFRADSTSHNSRQAQPGGLLAFAPRLSIRENETCARSWLPLHVTVAPFFPTENWPFYGTGLSAGSPTMSTGCPVSIHCFPPPGNEIGGER